MFALDIRGHLNSLRLAESKALWPLFEAVVNSIQSIEDSPNRDNGKITIFAQREDQDPNLTIQKDVLERFESFVIEDNGNGMNTANYRSFNTAYSTLKIQKGCKGIGRFLWLKAFETVEIESVFQEVAFEEMNLWIVDERLAYHRYLASDKTLKSMPVIDSDSRKEPDIVVFDQAFAYSDSDEPLSTVTIVEFKKPDNDSKNLINQVGEYVDLIRSGKKKKANGQAFSITEGTLFRCYVICDLTDKMRTHCLNSSLLPTADNLGYTGFNQFRHEYIEVISYTKLLADAKKRNQILFDKLFSPNPGEVIHASAENTAHI